MRWVPVAHGPEDIVNGRQRVAQDPHTLVVSLGHQNKVVDIDVDGCDGWATVGVSRRHERRRPVRIGWACPRTPVCCCPVRTCAGDNGICWRCGGHRLQSMNRTACALVACPQGGVRQIAGGFSEHREIRWRLHPPHGEGEREGHKGSVPGGRRKHNAQLEDVPPMQPHPVEAVRDVNLGEPHRAVLWVGSHDRLQDALQGSAELHRFLGGKRHSFIVDAREAVVDNQPRASVALGDDAQWRNP